MRGHFHDKLSLPKWSECFNRITNDPWCSDMGCTSHAVICQHVRYEHLFRAVGSLSPDFCSEPLREDFFSFNAVCSACASLAAASLYRVTDVEHSTFSDEPEF